MPKTTIYHNPRCSKSRQTLAILEAHELDIEVIKYLENPPTAATIQQLLTALKLDVRDILRTGEKEYKEHDFKDDTLTDADLINKLTQYPKVMQRPIVVHGDKAIVGRPPENVLELFK